MPSRPTYSGQDWEPQVYNFNKKPSANAGAPRRLNTAEANRAVQQGGQVEIKKREHLSYNQQQTTAGANAKKIDEDHETLKVKRVSHSLSVTIQKARQAKGLTQQQLAQQISERASVVTEYENGKAATEERVLVKMERALGVHLRGAKAGEPLVKKAPAK